MANVQSFYHYHVDSCNIHHTIPSVQIEWTDRQTFLHRRLQIRTKWAFNQSLLGLSLNKAMPLPPNIIIITLWTHQPLGPSGWLLRRLTNRPIDHFLRVRARINTTDHKLHKSRTCNFKIYSIILRPPFIHSLATLPLGLWLGPPAYMDTHRFSTYRHGIDHDTESQIVIHGNLNQRTIYFYDAELCRHGIYSWSLLHRRGTNRKGTGMI